MSELGKKCSRQKKSPIINYSGYRYLLIIGRTDSMLMTVKSGYKFFRKKEGKYESFFLT